MLLWKITHVKCFFIVCWFSPSTVSCFLRTVRWNSCYFRGKSMCPASWRLVCSATSLQWNRVCQNGSGDSIALHWNALESISNVKIEISQQDAFREFTHHQAQKTRICFCIAARDSLRLTRGPAYAKGSSIWSLSLMSL